MSDIRQSIQDFLRVSDDLLKTEELTDAEMEAIEVMLERLSDKVLNDAALTNQAVRRSTISEAN